MTGQLHLFDKRWHRRNERWARPDRAVFEATGFGVEVIPQPAAKAFICEHHYSGSFPAARVSVGLFRKHGPCSPKRLIGVSVFSVGMPGAVNKHTGLPGAGIECGRFVCLPEVAYNGETWFQARTFHALQAEKTEVRAVVSYADPLERRTAAGEVCKAAHSGTIYRAGNATYVGRARGGPIYLTRDGLNISRRVITKILGGESGSRYCERLLVVAGADERLFGESPHDWVARVLVEPTFRRINHPGNLAYVFGLDRAAKAAAAERAQPYPQIARAA